MTMLVALVALPAQTAMSECDELLEDTSKAPSHADNTAQWPHETAISLATIINGLTYSRSARNRMLLSTALSQLESMCLELRGSDNEIPMGLVLSPEEHEVPGECVVCMSELRAVRFGCGHLVCCTGCADILREERMGCPNCRAPIATTAGASATEPTFIAVGQPLFAVRE